MSMSWVGKFIEGITDFAGDSSLRSATKSSAKFVADNINPDAIASAKSANGLGTFLKKLFGVAGRDADIMQKRVTGEMAKRISSATAFRQAAEKTFSKAGLENVKSFDDAFDLFSAGKLTGASDELTNAFTNYQTALSGIGVKADVMSGVSRNLGTLAGDDVALNAINSMASFGSGDAWGMSLRSLFENRYGKITTGSIMKGVARGSAPVWGAGLTIAAMKTPQRLIENVTEARAREGKL